jgi:hypothetical protein
MHPETRTEVTIAQHFYWKVCVILYQESRAPTNVSTIKYGQVPPKPRPEIVPWHICIDLIGPHKVGEDITAMRKDKNGERARVIKKAPILWCLTIDPATGWFIVESTIVHPGEAANELEINCSNGILCPLK